MAEAITAEFGGEERRFLVQLGQLRSIQEKSDAGPFEIARRLARCVQVRRQMKDASILDQVTVGLGDARIDDVREPILQGLIGGGLSPNEAGRLVRKWVDERGFEGLAENAELALVLTVAGVSAPKGEVAAPPGEPPAGATTPPPS